MVGALASRSSATCSASMAGASSWSSRSGSRWAIVVVALIFLFNVSMTVLKGRRTAITNVLLLGHVGHRGLLPVRLL